MVILRQSTTFFIKLDISLAPAVIRFGHGRAHKCSGNSVTYSLKDTIVNFIQFWTICPLLILEIVKIFVFLWLI